MNEATCPYCHDTLEKVPKRKSKCPECGQYIHVRTTQDLFPRHLLTSHESLVLDQMGNYEWLGIQSSDYNQVRDELSIKFNQDPDPYDVLWGVYTKFLIEAMRVGDHYRLKVLYYAQALFLSETGRDFSTLLELSNKMQLLGFQEKGYGKVRVQNSVACRACQENVGKEFMVSDIIDAQPIPCKECETILFEGSSGFCRCNYVPVR